MIGYAVRKTLWKKKTSSDYIRVRDQNLDPKDRSASLPPPSNNLLLDRELKEGGSPRGWLPPTRGFFSYSPQEAKWIDYPIQLVIDWYDGGAASYQCWWLAKWDLIIFWLAFVTDPTGPYTSVPPAELKEMPYVLISETDKTMKNYIAWRDNLGCIDKLKSGSFLPYKLLFSLKEIVEFIQRNHGGLLPQYVDYNEITVNNSMQAAFAVQNTQSSNIWGVGPRAAGVPSGPPSSVIDPTGPIPPVRPPSGVNTTTPMSTRINSRRIGGDALSYPVGTSWGSQSGNWSESVFPAIRDMTLENFNGLLYIPAGMKVDWVRSRMLYATAPQYVIVYEVDTQSSTLSQLESMPVIGTVISGADRAIRSQERYLMYRCVAFQRWDTLAGPPMTLEEEKTLANQLTKKNPPLKFYPIEEWVNYSWSAQFYEEMRQVSIDHYAGVL